MTTGDVPHPRLSREPAGQRAADLPHELPAGSPVEELEAALGVIPPRPQLPLPRWLGPLALSCVVGIIPWIIYLAVTLPGRSRADDYDIAWVGFDCAMAVVLGALAYCALTRKPVTGPIAAVAATMLAMDAWFDVVTTEPGARFTFAVLSAVFAELPLAVICAWTAVNAERVRARAYRRMRLRWERAVAVAESLEHEYHDHIEHDHIEHDHTAPTIIPANPAASAEG